MSGVLEHKFLVALGHIEELEAQLAEEIKISNERGNHIEFVLLPQMSDLSAQLAAMTAERDAAIPRAYAMGVSSAASIAGSPFMTWGDSMAAIRALTPPDDLVERVLKGGK